MEVILSQDIPKLGRVGDVVKVKEGFARNFLIPQKMAYFATPGNVKRIAQQKAKIVIEQEKIKKEAEDIGKENNKIRWEGDQFNLSVVFFQIGIMLSSVSALLKRKEMWVIGVLFGCIAAVFLVDGIFLFF